MVILKAFWKEILILVLAISCGCFAYTSIYTKAATEVLSEYNTSINTRIGELETASNTLVVRNEKQAELLAKNIDKILIASKAKPLTIVKEGKCTLSQDFSDSYNALILEGTAK